MYVYVLDRNKYIWLPIIRINVKVDNLLINNIAATYLLLLADEYHHLPKQMISADVSSSCWWCCLYRFQSSMYEMQEGDSSFALSSTGSSLNTIAIISSTEVSLISSLDFHSATSSELNTSQAGILFNREISLLFLSFSNDLGFVLFSDHLKSQRMISSCVTAR